MRKAGKVGVVALAAAAVCAVAATAAVPAGTPDPSLVVLKAADFTGAKDVQHVSLGAQGALVAAYQNVVEFKTTYGASKYSDIISTAFVSTDVPNATSAYTRLARTWAAPATRLALVKEFAGSTKNVKLTSVKPRPLGVPDSSSETGFVATIAKKGTVSFSIELLRVDRIVVENIAIGAGKKIMIGDAKALTGITAGHAKTVLMPGSVSVPAITGTATVGQTLTASPGTWNGSSPTFAYQWQDCDATGTTCTPIANAASSTYVLQATDANQTVRVTVTATNAYGTASANSAITAPVASG